MINSRSKVLVVDDEFTSRRLMEKIIRDEFNCNVFQAEEGSEALKVMLKELPDLVILDMVMPFMNGIQVLQTMRKSDRLSHMNVLACTAVDDNKIVKEVLKLGVLDYMVKPINRQALVDKVTKIFTKNN